MQLVALKYFVGVEFSLTRPAPFQAPAGADQNLKLANALTPIPGIKTSSLV